MEAIKIKNIIKSFNDTPVLRGISLDIGVGENLVLIGKSGSGKTTLLKLLNGLDKPSGGEIYIRDQNTADISGTELRRSLGYVIQKVGLLPHLTVKENLMIPLKIIGAKESDDKFFETLLRRVKLDSYFLNQYPHELSGGQQQRVGLARALVNDPDIILMDEPFSALDPITRKELQNDLLDLKELSSNTMVIVTHDIEEAIKLGDRIALLDQGVLQQLGTPEEILFRPANQFVKDFIGQEHFTLKMKVTTCSDIGLELSLTENPSVFELLSTTTVTSDQKRQVLDKFYEFEAAYS